MSQRAGGRTAGIVVGTIVGVGVAAVGLLVIGMRWKVPAVLDGLRRMNRSLTNPRVMRTAGTAGTQTSVIRHIGRTSGRAYATPVDVIATGDDFLIALPYGSRADWVRNVIAAGAATVVRDGDTAEVEEPTIVATGEVADRIPARTRTTLRLFGVTECLHLRRSADGPG